MFLIPRKLFFQFLVIGFHFPDCFVLGGVGSANDRGETPPCMIAAQEDSPVNIITIKSRNTEAVSMPFQWRAIKSVVFFVASPAAFPAFFAVPAVFPAVFPAFCAAR